MNPIRFCRSVALPAMLVLAGCATTGHPCFTERTMYPDRTTSCQYGRVYQCDNGDWIAARESCSSPAPQVAAAGAVPATCEFGGISFSSGAASCNAGTQYRCDNGRWTSLGTACPAADAPLRVAPYGRSCSYQGTTVASSSAICQSGSTFVCSDGEWINLGTGCL
jgi:hypothetical protein